MMQSELTKCAGCSVMSAVSCFSSILLFVRMHTHTHTPSSDTQMWWKRKQSSFFSFSYTCPIIMCVCCTDLSRTAKLQWFMLDCLAYVLRYLGFSNLYTQGHFIKYACVCEEGWGDMFRYVNVYSADPLTFNRKHTHTGELPLSTKSFITFEVSMTTDGSP